MSAFGSMVDTLGLLLYYFPDHLGKWVSKFLTAIGFSFARRRMRIGEG